jgi:hypothetical protein
VAHTSGSNDKPQSPVFPDPEEDPEAAAEAAGTTPGEIDSHAGGLDPAPNQPPADHGSQAGTAGDGHQGTQAQDGTTSQGTSQQPVTTTTVPAPQPPVSELPPQSPYEPNLEGIAIVIVGGLAILITKVTRAIRGS